MSNIANNRDILDPLIFLLAAHDRTRDTPCLLVYVLARATSALRWIFSENQLFVVMISLCSVRNLALPTRSQKRKRGASSMSSCTSGLLYWSKAPISVKNGAMVDLVGKKWEVCIVPTGLDLVLVESTSNKGEWAKLRRLNIKNEIEQLF